MLSIALLIYSHSTVEQPESQPVLEMKEIDWYHENGRLREGGRDTWPEMTQKMENLIEAEITDLDKILQGIDGFDSEEEFLRKARGMIIKPEPNSREAVLKKKAEQNLPGKDHHSVEVMWAGVFMGAHYIQVKIALNITVTGESIPKALEFGVQFGCFQFYKVELPGATNNHPMDADDIPSQKTYNTSKPGSQSNYLDRSKGRSFTGVSGFTGVTALGDSNHQQRMTGPSFTSGV
jgi:hypothetical protein